MEKLDNSKRKKFRLFPSMLLALTMTFIFTVQAFSNEEYILEGTPQKKKQKVVWSNYTPVFNMGAMYYMRWPMRGKTAIGYRSGTPGHIASYCSGPTIDNGRCMKGGHCYSCAP
jgi:hypothetical protein